MSNYKDELRNSSINEFIITKNFTEIEGEEAFSSLLYSLGTDQRTNTGKLKEYWLKKYSHLWEGGWFCGAGIDLNSLENKKDKYYGTEKLWGCFKPYKPRKINGKTIKYEHPPQTETEIFTLKIGLSSWQKIINTNGYQSSPPASLIDHPSLSADFWEWVLTNPVPVLITEGAKKTACLLSSGYCAIGLPGIFSAYRGEDQDLHPDLKLLSIPGREFVICFDEDTKWLTRKEVFRATKKLGEKLEIEGSSVSVVCWDSALGKGIDDLIALKGEGEFSEIFDNRLSLSEYIEKEGKVRELKYPEWLAFVQRHFSKDLAFNEMTKNIELKGAPFLDEDGFRAGLVEDYGIQVYRQWILEVFSYEAKKRSYHPVKSYLKQCYENRKDFSIDNLADRYLGTNDPLYNIYLKKWLIAAVARMLEVESDFCQGCKVDFALILQQRSKGTNKSSFFATLGGKWFDDNFGAQLDSHKSLMALHEVWIEEWSEIDQVTSKKEANQIKSFITRVKDKFIPPYGRVPQDFVRRFVFCGTTNEQEFLRDGTGPDRRFAIIPLPPDHRINISLVREERDLIWGRAVEEYLAGKARGENAWVFSTEEESLLMINNSQFDRKSVVSEELEAWILDNFEDFEGILSNSQIIDSCFSEKVGSMNASYLQNQISSTMTALGWSKGVFWDSFLKKSVRGWRRSPLPPQKEEGTPLHSYTPLTPSCKESVRSETPPVPTLQENPYTLTQKKEKKGNPPQKTTRKNPIPDKQKAEKEKREKLLPYGARVKFEGKIYTLSVRLDDFCCLLIESGGTEIEGKISELEVIDYFPEGLAVPTRFLPQEFTSPLQKGDEVFVYQWENPQECERGVFKYAEIYTGLTVGWAIVDFPEYSAKVPIHWLRPLSLKKVSV